ncbi:MAG TPA: pyrimidine 5'-nucleotidase [Chloroflexi bacterium]|nr:pyrimidine 5'-nucleotidase [Chloroflexota bacterium]HBY08321.1 pyrimidine 5'-nucleotidase [Chloroflexota bacterium]
MSFETIFFDLDATLYPESNGLWPAIRHNIDRYMLEQMKIPEAEIPPLREHYFLHYGTTLRGLQIHHGISMQDYLNFVHDLPLHEYLQPDPALRDLLLSLPQRRWIFTNSDQPHAERVMNMLGIADCFEGMVDVYALEPHCKPQPEAYQLALEIAGAPDPQKCALLDDSTRNLAPARELGYFTVLVGRNGTHPSAHRTLIDIHDLPKVVPEFWENQRDHPNE